MTAGRTPAQLYALGLGIVLVLVGILGFVVDASFDTGSNVQGDELILFEVNGWHNLVHIASGLVGLALAGKNSTARLYAFGFGAVYGVVTLWGIIDGESVLGLIPVNGADNVLHLAIAAVGILAAIASPEGDRGGSRRTATTA
jgi:hypothetical protein